MRSYNVPYELQPLSPWSYFWLTILFSIPVIGFIATIVLALSNSNINRRNFARSYFCWIIVVGIIIGITIALRGGIGMIGTFLNQ